jgi:hypothetical protein
MKRILAVTSDEAVECGDGSASVFYLNNAGNFKSVVQIPHASGMPTTSQ